MYTSKTDLVFIMAIYKRHDLTAVVLDYYRKLKKKFGFEIVIAGSEGEVSRQLAHGFDYIEVENFPLSQKNNAMMLRAQIHKPKAVVLLGSDDFICENIIKFYYDLINKKEKSVVGFYDLYFYSTAHEYLSHLDCGLKSYGAGRFFPLSVLKKIKWTGWHGEYNKGLDGNNMRVLTIEGVEHKVVKLEEVDGFLVDVKHTVNISNKNITFVGKHSNKKIMARRKIPVKKLDALEIKKELIPQPIEVVKVDIFDDKKYTFISNGKSKSLKKESKLTGWECKILIKKGLGNVATTN
jgi:hypothetical protein